MNDQEHAEKECVLEALKAAEVNDRVRQAAETIHQALIEAELTAVIGAAPSERSPARSAQRNGHRNPHPNHHCRDLELRIPEAAYRLVLPQPA